MRYPRSVRGALACFAVLAAAAAGCEGGGPIDTCAMAPTFTNDIRPTIIEVKCIGCHSAALQGSARNGAPDGLDFDTYESTEPNIRAFADSISSGREPPMGLTPPLATTAEERDLVIDWRTCGYPR
jgi:uncharacterized membrane protein